MASGNTVEGGSQLDTMAQRAEHLLERIQMAISKASRAADTLFGPIPTSAGPGGADKQAARSGAIGRVHDAVDRGHAYLDTLESELARFNDYANGGR